MSHTAMSSLREVTNVIKELFHRNHLKKNAMMPIIVSGKTISSASTWISSMMNSNPNQTICSLWTIQRQFMANHLPHQLKWMLSSDAKWEFMILSHLFSFHFRNEPAKMHPCITFVQRTRESIDISLIIWTDSALFSTEQKKIII